MTMQLTPPILVTSPTETAPRPDAELSPAWAGWQVRAKRALDIVLAVIGLVVLAPVMALVALAIKLDSPGPIVFRQTRCGKDGRTFTFLKFRGMVVDAEARLAELARLNEADGPIFKIKHDPRVTRVGRFIRRTSLDELPQLWNVLRGEMSLVGPRPPLPSEVARYEPWQRDRLRVVPGITGMWQTHGRSELSSFAAMVRLDFEYMRRWSIWLDVQLLVQTVLTVVSTKGAC
jgi:exopolysaccharide biosynthesis polyprenyl glycosylphosphotransferase